MSFNTTFVCGALAAALMLSSAAQAQQQPSGMSNMGAMSGPSMRGMGGMQGNSMAGMNMDDMMRHCAKMHDDMVQNRPMSSDMRKMMGECQQMESQMKPAQAPAATLSR